MKQASRTVLFADVCDSSRLFEESGDAAARALIRDLLERCAGCVQGHRGEVIKTIGDEIMAAFRSVQDAVDAAVSLLRELDSPGVEATAGLRIGLHHGDVLVEEGDLYGSTVNTAARMVAMARCGQIIASAESTGGLAAGAPARRSLGEHHLPGQAAPLEVVEIVWQEGGAITSVSTRPSLSRSASENALNLRWGELELQMNAGSPALSLGRDASVDLVIDADWVSRLHAVIEYRRGFFMLRDVSTNGTFVTLNGGDVVTLHRNELTLRGRGFISLGREPTRDPGPQLSFHCE